MDRFSTSQKIGAYDEQRMDPKDERLVLMAYNVGLSQSWEQKFYDLERQLNRVTSERDSLSSSLDMERRHKNQWQTRAHELEGQYDRLKKRTAPKKPAKKASKK